MRNNLPATKADIDKAIAKLVTKNELEAVEKRLNWKIDLVEKRLNGKIDLVEKRLNDKIDGSERAVRAGTRLDIDERTKELEEKINLLPTKNEFFTEMDKQMKELLAMREVQIITSYQLKDHGERIGVLEQTAGIVTI